MPWNVARHLIPQRRNASKLSPIISRCGPTSVSYTHLKFIAPRKPIEEDCLNLQHLPWRNPWKTEKISHASLLELYQQAVSCMYRELNALEAFLKGRDDGVCLIALIGDTSYHSGLPENVSLHVTSVSEQKEAR